MCLTFNRSGVHSFSSQPLLCDYYANESLSSQYGLTFRLNIKNVAVRIHILASPVGIGGA